MTATTTEPPTTTTEPGTDQPIEERVPLIKRLRQELADNPKDEAVLLPRELVEQVVGWLFRLPDSKEKTVTRPFGEKHRALIRVALDIHAEALTKEAKKLEQLGQQGMADKLTAEAGTLTDRIRPEFHEQPELPLVDPKAPEPQLESATP